MVAFWIRSAGLRVEARPLPVPSYHDELDPPGVPYRTYAMTQEVNV